MALWVTKDGRRRMSPIDIILRKLGYASSEIADSLERAFDLRWEADMRAIRRWQAATGRDSVWPDHADLCVWLLEQLDIQEQEISRLRAALRFCMGKTVRAVVSHIENDKVLNDGKGP